jgi:hypothetical protein
MAFLVFLAVIAPALLAWYSVFWVIPSALQSSLEGELWRLRDQIFDEALNGRYDDAQAAGLVGQQIAALAKRSKSVSVGSLFLLRSLTRGLFRERTVLSTDLSAHDRELLEAHVSELKRLLTRHARWRTPSGWLLGWSTGFKVSEADTVKLLEVTRPEPSLSA